MSLTQADATVVTVGIPGSLAAIVESPSAETQLTISGTIDSRDLRFVAESMPALRSLDLSHATIAQNGSYPAGCIPEGIFAGSQIFEIVFPTEGDIYIADMAFMGSALTSVRLPSNVKSMGTGAFAACKRLKLTVVETKEVGAHAFADCTTLNTLVLSGVASIGASAFSECLSLSQIEGENNLQHIGSKAFAGCSMLQKFNFGERLLAIGDGAFSFTALSEVDLSAATALKTLSPWTFAHCEALHTVVLPTNSTSIPEALFFEDEGLSSITFPSAVDSIADYAFCGNSDIRQIVLPERLSAIGSLAMRGTTGLTSIDATKLTAAPSLGDDVWEGVDCAAVRLAVTPELFDAFSTAEQWSEFDITAASTSANSEIKSDEYLRLIVAGYRLHVVSSTPLKSLRVYSTDGQLLSSERPASNEHWLELSKFGTQVIVVEVVNAEGLTKTKKLWERTN